MQRIILRWLNLIVFNEKAKAEEEIVLKDEFG